MLKKSSEEFVYLIDSMKIKVPLFGELIKKLIIARFSRTLGSLLTSGIGIIQALEITRRIIQNKVIQRRIDRMIVEVKGGGHLENIIQETALFPPIMIQMVAVGNQTGHLDIMLTRSSDYLDQEVESVVKRLLAVLDPLLTIFIAVIIGFIAVSIYLPMFNAYNLVK